MPISKSQLDRLGERIRKGERNNEDFRLLEEYRNTFAEAHEKVAKTIRIVLSLEPSMRAKTRESIADKLFRESIRLTQMQDIAGCRLVVADVLIQDTVVERLSRVFEKTALVDRREKPSHGYRAVHIIVDLEGNSVEIQVRTAMQQLWAELSEKLTDITGTALKYGKGDANLLKRLDEASMEISRFESLEAEMKRPSERLLDEKEEMEFEKAENTLNAWRKTIFVKLHTLRISVKDQEKGNDIFN